MVPEDIQQQYFRLYLFAEQQCKGDRDDYSYNEHSCILIDKMSHRNYPHPQMMQLHINHLRLLQLQGELLNQLKHYLVILLPQLHLLPSSA